LQSALATAESYQTLEQAERDVARTGPIFDWYILQLQALSLEFAYQNTRILVHRAFLSPKIDLGAGQLSTKASQGLLRDAFREAVRTCHDAGLQTAKLGALPTFAFATRSYAAAFLKPHLFTAGVALSLSALTEPLTEFATAVKTGLRDIFALRDTSSADALPSVKVERLWRKLVSVVLGKEKQLILGQDMDARAQSLRGTRPKGDEASATRAHADLGPGLFPPNVRHSLRNAEVEGPGKPSHGITNIERSGPATGALPGTFLDNDLTMYDTFQGFEDVTLYRTLIASFTHADNLSAFISGVSACW
jgi:hypothetical protein